MSDPPLRLTVRLYSILRHRGDQMIDRLELELPSGSRVQDVLALLDVPADLEVILALNDQVTDPTAVLSDGDRLALIPAVAGGSGLLGRVV